MDAPSVAPVCEPSPASSAVIAALAEAGNVAPGPDRFLAPDLEAAYETVLDGAVVTAAEAVTGRLN